MAYEVRIKSSALRELGRLAEQIRARVDQAIRALGAQPRPPGVQKLAGATNLYRIRVGDYRIVYQIQDRVLLVLVVRVGHRGDVYR